MGEREEISALNSAVNERRGRGFFFPMLSMMDILPGLNPWSRMSVKADQAQYVNPRVPSSRDSWRPRGPGWLAAAGSPISNSLITDGRAAMVASKMAPAPACATPGATRALRWSAVRSTPRVRGA
jgi:hypothetical protein